MKIARRFITACSCANETSTVRGEIAYLVTRFFRPYGLRGSAVLAPKPTVETVGYYRDVPAGQTFVEFLERNARDGRLRTTNEHQ